MEFKSLNNIPVETLHRAFTDAFSDYAVKMEITLSQFVELITSRSFSPKDSMGCFIDNQLVGFVFCGLRIYNQELSGYDIATGVIKQYQHQGVAKTMMKKLLAHLSVNSFSCFKLEVLEQNGPAIELYKNQGFRITRRLECYEASKESLLFPSKEMFHFNTSLRKLSKLDITEYQLYQPSWQNDLVSVGNAIDNFCYVAIEKDDRIIGFGFIQLDNGRIPQLGILTHWRNQGLEAVIVGKLANQTASRTISFINVEAGSYLSKILLNLGMNLTTMQFEMQINIQN